MQADEGIPRRRSSLVLLSHDPQETFRIGRVLGEALRGGDCVALLGELGAGKTSLTQGIARGLGVPDDYVVTSPTFTLINEYPGQEVALYHMDVYRLGGSAELAETGYEEYLLSGGIVVIEWAEKIMDLIPDNAMIIELSYVSEQTRQVKISDCESRISSLQKIFSQGG